MSTRSYFPIEHVIVLMLENRSYDHMLGYLPNGHGLAGDEFNLVDPSDPTTEKVHVSNTAGYISADPAHDFVSVEKQLYGKAGQVVDPGPMNGFVAVHIEQEKGQVDSAIYEHSSLPATLKTLFNLPEGLTARDKAANTFEKNLSRRIPRSDTPLMLPVPGEPEESRSHRDLLRTDALEKWRRGEVDPATISHEPITTFQASLVEIGHLLNKKAHARAPAAQIQTEQEAAIHISESLTRFLES